MRRAHAAAIRRRRTITAGLLAVTVLLAGCGQRGPLVLPGTTSPSPPAQTPPAGDEPEPQDDDEQTENER